MPGIDYREARARLPLAEVLDLLGFVPRRRGGDQLRGPCPVHRSRSPASRSFAAHLGKGVWHCFGCGAGGNALDLWAAVTRQGVQAAVLDLCRRLGRDVPWLPQGARCWEPSRVRERGTNAMHDP
jgi:DNA primase